MIRPLFSQDIYIRLVLEATTAFEHWDDQAGYADPIKTTNSLAAAAARLGVDIVEGVRVTGIVVRGGQVQAVTTDAGRIATRQIVNCAGAWSDSAFRMTRHRSEQCEPAGCDRDASIRMEGRA